MNDLVNECVMVCGAIETIEFNGKLADVPSLAKSTGLGRGRVREALTHLADLGSVKARSVGKETVWSVVPLPKPAPVLAAIEVF
jgi:DNA-binding FadR family transcriptional regulator